MRITEKELQNFSGYLKLREKAAVTVQKYCRETMGFAHWLAGQEITREAACAYKETLAEARSPAGVNGAVAALNCFFDFLGLSECRLRSARIQRQTFRDEARELTQKEYQRLLTAAKGQQNERLLLVMETICATGIRVSELRFFTVEAVRTGRTDVTNKGKTRTVFLPDKLRKVLLRYAGARHIASGSIFVTRGGKPLDRSNIWRDMKRLCAAAGVAQSKVFPHNLRHLFARVYYSLEKDIVRLADILGHASINTTRIYTMESGNIHRQQLERLQLVL